MTMSHRRFEHLRVGDALKLQPLRVPPEWHKTPVKYRYSPGVLDRLLERAKDQGHKCAICEIREPGGRWPVFKMDHCHGTGFVRSMLCHGCNTTIPSTAASARRLADYLEFWESMFAFYEQGGGSVPGYLTELQRCRE
jgi:hypothetical protein